MTVLITDDHNSWIRNRSNVKLLESIFKAEFKLTTTAAKNRVRLPALEACTFKMKEYYNLLISEAVGRGINKKWRYANVRNFKLMEELSNDN